MSKPTTGLNWDWASTKPGPIHNSELLEQDGTLKPGLVETVDYALVSDVVWQALQSRYSGGPEIPRPVISLGGYFSSCLSVEVCPLTLKIVKSSDPASPIRCCFSRIATVGNLKRTMCEALGLDPDNVRIWDYHEKVWLRLLRDCNHTLCFDQIIDNQWIMLEEKNDNGSWPHDHWLSS
ncbi:peptidase C19 family protein [Pelomyxa schiedti]|nr:peptidase C19 family protein [Pelomyxa schiedti]